MPHSRAERPATATTQRAAVLVQLGVLFTVTGAIGLVMAVILLVEKIALIQDPTYVPTCSLNPVLSCGSVMATPQAAAFGIPNPILGIAGFAAVLALGTALLAGARFTRWLRVLIQAGVTFAVLFVHWLIAQSLYVIGALCPYCMVVWAVTIPLFWFTTVHHLQPLLSSRTPAVRRTIRLVTEFRFTVLIAWYLIILALITVGFWDYWSTLI